MWNLTVGSLDPSSSDHIHRLVESCRESLLHIISLAPVDFVGNTMASTSCVHWIFKVPLLVKESSSAC